MLQKNNLKLSVEGLAFLEDMFEPDDPIGVIDQMVVTFLPKGTTDSQKERLKSILTDGLPDFEWTIQYQEYLDNPNDQNNKDAVIKRLKETFNALFLLPEFQTN